MITKTKVILASMLAISIMSISLVIQPQIFAEEEEKSQYTKANNVAIHTVFTFREAVEESDNFQAFTQISGFDRSEESPTFSLIGEMGFDRSYLYEAADMTLDRGINNVQHEYGQFDVDVYLHKEGTAIRQFSYTDCHVTDYHVSTLFDKEEGWNSSKGFATLDNFKFECSGFKPTNPIYETLTGEAYNGISQSSMDLKNTQTWPDTFQ